MGGQESGLEPGGVDVVKAHLDVQEEGGDLYSGSLEGCHLGMRQRQASEMLMAGSERHWLG